MSDFSLWHGVRSELAPGMATENPFTCQPVSFEVSVFGDGLDCVLRTGRMKAAVSVGIQASEWSVVERERLLIQADEPDHGFWMRMPSFLRLDITLASRSAYSEPTALAKAMTSTS